MIEMKDLYFAYGKKEIFTGYNLMIPKGSAMALVGVSGIGKTTLIRLLLGLLTPQKGEILGISNRKISTVFQEDRLLPHLTVKDNLLFTCPAVTKEEMEGILCRLGLQDVLDQLPLSLSGGMTRRVALARAILYGGEVYILDEPFKGLDAENRQLAYDLLREEVIEKGKTLMLITHQEEDIRVLGLSVVNIST